MLYADWGSAAATPQPVSMAVMFKIMIKKLFILILLLTLPSVCIVNCQPAVDFSSPENTIKTYFENYNNREILSKCFYPNEVTGSRDKWWLEYRIVSSKATNKVGETTYSEIRIGKDGVEIITEVKMLHSAKNNPKTKFWYLLQKIKGEWKILEHSHIPDKNYPAYD